jgi:heme/copper-type cytochrome/quinol oxidase subunit 1
MKQPDTPAPTLMPEFAIGMTVLLIAAPVLLVGGTMWMAMKKRLAARHDEQPVADNYEPWP